VAQVVDVFGHSVYVWMLQRDVVLVLLDLGLQDM
jgi:hypothetical protein